jgi:hypothetical protein
MGICHSCALCGGQVVESNSNSNVVRAEVERRGTSSDISCLALLRASRPKRSSSASPERTMEISVTPAGACLSKCTFRAKEYGLWNQVLASRQMKDAQDVAHLFNP